MNQIEAKRAALAQHRKSLVADRDRLTEEIAKIDAKDEVLAELLGETNDALAGSHAAQVLDIPNVTVKDAVAEVVERFTSPFTKEDVSALLTATYPALRFTKRSLEKPINALLEAGKIRVARKGNAKVPAVYENTTLPLIRITDIDTPTTKAMSG